MHSSETYRKLFKMTKKKNKSNIINFPGGLSNPETPEEIADRLIEYKKSYSDEIAEILWQNILGELTRSGCDFHRDIDKFYPSMILVLESIRSLHLLNSGISHPLQEFADNTITSEDIKITVDIDDEID